MKRREYLVKIVVERDGSGFYAYCPGLPEVHTYGETQDEAAHNARNAAIAVLRTKKKYNVPISVGPDLIPVDSSSKRCSDDFEKREESILLPA